jgi:hypothetical protein
LEAAWGVLGTNQRFDRFVVFNAEGGPKAELIVHSNDINFLSLKRDARDAPDHSHDEETELSLETAA